VRLPGWPRRLPTRFRVASLLLLSPLIGVAVVSGISLARSAEAGTNLAQAQQEAAKLESLHSHLQDVALAGTAYAGAGGPDELTVMATGEADVEADLAGLVKLPSLDSAQVTAVGSIRTAWLASADARRGIGDSNPTTLSRTAAAALEDQLNAGIGTTVSRLDELETLNNASVDSLRRQQLDREQQAAATVGLAVLVGLVGALWVSRSLAASVIGPLRQLRLVSERLAAGDTTQRAGIESQDEVADVGAAFDRMADQLAERAEAVRRRERRLFALVENASDGILVVRADGTIDFATPAFSAAFVPESDSGVGLGSIVHPEDMDRVRKAWVRILAGGVGSFAEIEARVHRRDGQWRHVWANLANRIDDPAVEGVVLNLSDVSERREYEERLSYQALHDSLTGLANRTLLGERLERATSGDKRRRLTISLLYVDFDGFKQVNDVLGHAAGDQLLVSIGQRLVAAVRPEDTVARLGGDEYAILLEGTAQRDAVRTAERILEALRPPHQLEGRDVVSTASIGIASAAAASISPETLISDADLAMYFAKRRGKNCYEVFDQVMRDELLDRMRLGEDLRLAIDAGTIQVQYQPIVDLQSGAVVGSEALARWHHAERGWVGPDVFIPLAEELGIVDRLDALVLREACRQGKAWVEAGLPPLTMSVNLSGRNLEKPDLVGSIARTLQETGLPPEWLQLELTEGVAIAESTDAQATLYKLKDLGIRLAIDDFGTGYSALARLRSLPFDRLKVDKAFVDELADGGDGGALVATILEMASVLGMSVVAEGVETTSQADFLRRRSCDLAQGYLFSRPLDPAGVESILRKQRAAGAEAEPVPSPTRPRRASGV
jgi:diguanylate cyclase (GGDEF)-like protein/PAS domain S-box-containing protein